VGFAARFDQEKQPGFFMDLVEEYTRVYPDVKFAVFSGGPLRSNNPEYVERARALNARGVLEIYENISKNRYYELLNDTRVLFNCALQDWVSNTVSEADTLGANVLFPAYRSFPETFSNDYTRLYTPWSLDDAINKLQVLLATPSPNIGKISNWTDQTVQRVIDIIHGKGEEWLRTGRDYRKYTKDHKYNL
jgi:hypothetical protein